MKDHSRVVEIGNKRVAFPDHMTDEQVTAAARNIYQRQWLDPNVVLRLVNGGAKVSDVAERVMDSMPVESRPAFRDSVRAAIAEKAASDPIKARKIFYALGETSRHIFGDTHDQVRKDFDKASKAALK
jgi:hypothetical protein